MMGFEQDINDAVDGVKAAAQERLSAALRSATNSPPVPGEEGQTEPAVVSETLIQQLADGTFKVEHADDVHGTPGGVTGGVMKTTTLTNLDAVYAHISDMLSPSPGFTQWREAISAAIAAEINLEALLGEGVVLSYDTKKDEPLLRFWAPPKAARPAPRRRHLGVDEAPPEALVPKADAAE